MPRAAWAGRGAARSARLRTRMPRTALARRLERRVTPRVIGPTPTVLRLVRHKGPPGRPHGLGLRPRGVRRRAPRPLARAVACHAQRRARRGGDLRGGGHRRPGARGGAWGFAATRETTAEAAEHALARALEVARA